MALLAVFIFNGTDRMNELSQTADFKIGTQKEAVNAYLFSYSKVSQPWVDRGNALLDEEFMQKIINMEELDKKSMKKIYGYYGSYHYTDKFIQPMEEAAYATGTSNTAMTIQAVDNQYILKLENYAIKNHFKINTESLRNGKGILILHKHVLSEMLESEANQMVGEKARVYAMDETGEPQEEGVEFVCSGYLDTTPKEFPPLDMSWNGEGINYFLIGEQGYKRLNYPKQVFAFTISAKKGQEALAKEKLTKLIGKKNSEQKAANIYYLSCTSDKIAKITNYVNNSRTVMTALWLSLFLLGSANYLNVIITNMISRRKEFAIMESVGMTKRQLKKMLIAEGVYYWGILLITLMSAGTLMMLAVGAIIKKNLPYFKIVYPVTEFIVMAIALFILCVFLPQVVYIKTLEKSVAEQLRSEL